MRAGVNVVVSIDVVENFDDDDRNSQEDFLQSSTSPAPRPGADPEDDMAGMLFKFPGADRVEISLLERHGLGEVKIWDSPDKQHEIVFPTSLKVPTTLWVEGIQHSDPVYDLTFEYSYFDGTQGLEAGFAQINVMGVRIVEAPDLFAARGTADYPIRWSLKAIPSGVTFSVPPRGAGNLGLAVDHDRGFDWKFYFAERDPRKRDPAHFVSYVDGDPSGVGRSLPSRIRPLRGFSTDARWRVAPTLLAPSGAAVTFTSPPHRPRGFADASIQIAELGVPTVLRIEKKSNAWYASARDEVVHRSGANLPAAGPGVVPLAQLTGGGPVSAIYSGLLPETQELSLTLSSQAATEPNRDLYSATAYGGSVGLAFMTYYAQRTFPGEDKGELQVDPSVATDTMTARFLENALLRTRLVIPEENLSSGFGGAASLATAMGALAGKTGLGAAGPLAAVLAGGFSLGWAYATPSEGTGFIQAGIYRGKLPLGSTRFAFQTVGTEHLVVRNFPTPLAFNGVQNNVTSEPGDTFVMVAWTNMGIDGRRHMLPPGGLNTFRAELEILPATNQSLFEVPISW